VAVCGAEPDVEALNGLCKTFSVQRIWMLPSARDRASAQDLFQSGAEVLFSAHAQWSAAAGKIRIDLN
jgi:hypothetical protein